jgi:hypothetical protein
MIAAVGQSRIALEAEPLVIRRIAKNHATGGAQGSEVFEPCSDERLAQAMPLPVRPDGDRP